MSKTPTLVRRSQIGELLVAEGKLSRQELEAALAYREERGLKLGQALVALHLVTQQDLAGALRSQGRVHCLHLTPGIVDAEIARALPEEMARQYVAVPVHRVAGRITVAMEDPAEEYDVDAIAVALGEPIFAVHADPERILAVVAKVWPTARSGPHATEAAPAEPAAPRFTLVRGPLPDEDPDEAAASLVRAALREARALGAASFHVETTARGAELSFRVDGVRTPAAVLSADWAEPCARALVQLAGGARDATGAAGAAGCCDLDGSELELDVATIAGLHGPCARATLRTLGPGCTVSDLSLEPAERAAVEAWLDGSGLVLLVGASATGVEDLACDLAIRAAARGRRTYRLGGAEPVPDSGLVVVRRGARGDLAADLAAIALQSPDVVEAGRALTTADWDAAVDLARNGALVLVCTDAHDAAGAIAAVVAAATDPSVAATVCAGALALRAVRIPCTACCGAASRADCARCGGTGSGGREVAAEVLDLRRMPGVRPTDACTLRAAAEAAGMRTLDARSRPVSGLATEKGSR